MTCIGVVDMPFSLVIDTICLPFDFAGYLGERTKPTLEERREETAKRQERDGAALKNQE